MLAVGFACRPRDDREDVHQDGEIQKNDLAAKRLSQSMNLTSAEVRRCGVRGCGGAGAGAEVLLLRRGVDRVRLIDQWITDTGGGEAGSANAAAVAVAAGASVGQRVVAAVGQAVVEAQRRAQLDDLAPW